MCATLAIRIIVCTANVSVAVAVGVNWPLVFWEVSFNVHSLISISAGKWMKWFWWELRELTWLSLHNDCRNWCCHGCYSHWIVIVKIQNIKSPCKTSALKCWHEFTFAFQCNYTEHWNAYGIRVMWLRLQSTDMISKSALPCSVMSVCAHVYAEFILRAVDGSQTA